MGSPITSASAAGRCGRLADRTFFVAVGVQLVIGVWHQELAGQ
jgi:hypothetical protein